MDLERLVAKENRQELAQALSELHPVDIAELLAQQPPAATHLIMEVLSPEVAALVLNELPAKTAAQVLDNMPDHTTTALFAEMSFDDAVDLISGLPQPEQPRILNLLAQDDLEDIEELLAYGPETAGGIMTTEFMVVPENISVDQAIKAVREYASEAETIYYVYVIDLNNKLVGVVSLREMILADGFMLLCDFMQTKLVTVAPQTDQEEVAQLVAKYDLLAIPVVNQEQELLGIVTVDDIIDVIQAEATEDFYRLSGTVETDTDDDLQTKVWASFKARLPWLLITMGGGLLSGQVMKGFGDLLQTVVALTFFIPMLMGMGGNVGTQSSTIVVRGLATGYVDRKSVVTTLLKEFLVGLSIGAVCGLIVALVALFWQQNPSLGLVVGLAMTCNIMTAATIGTLVPLVFKKVGVDPAVASAPFISTTVDVTGLLIYATLAGIMLKYL